MSFGDFENADAFDTEPADAEQVARKLQALRVDEAVDETRWDDLDAEGKAVRVIVMQRLLDWFRREGLS